MNKNEGITRERAKEKRKKKEMSRESPVERR